MGRQGSHHDLVSVVQRAITRRIGGALDRARQQLMQSPSVNPRLAEPDPRWTQNSRCRWLITDQIVDPGLLDRVGVSAFAWRVLDMLALGCRRRHLP